MVRADLLKQLFRSYRNSDREQFMDAARTIVEEERKKHHPSLANELGRILQNGVAAASPTLSGPFQPPPRDQDRRTPLLEVRHPDRFFRELVISETQRRSLTRVIQEFRSWDILEANGLIPSHKLLFCGPLAVGKLLPPKLSHVRQDFLCSTQDSTPSCHLYWVRLRLTLGKCLTMPRKTTG